MTMMELVVELLYDLSQALFDLGWPVEFTAAMYRFALSFYLPRKGRGSLGLGVGFMIGGRLKR